MGKRIFHGMSNTRLYRIWKNMNKRCSCEKDQKYKNYGGRGIKVCDRWRGENGFINFLEDMGEEYFEKASIYGEENISIDRINVDGNYEKSNCRWATRDQQMNNKTDNRIVVYNGESLTLMQAIEKYAPNLPYTTALGRLNNGWSIDDIISIPSKELVEYNGELLTVHELYVKYADHRICESTFKNRFHKGIFPDIECALHELPKRNKFMKFIHPFSFRDGRNSGDGD